MARSIFERQTTRPKLFQKVPIDHRFEDYFYEEEHELPESLEEAAPEAAAELMTSALVGAFEQVQALEAAEKARMEAIEAAEKERLEELKTKTKGRVRGLRVGVHVTKTSLTDEIPSQVGPTAHCPIHPPCSCLCAVHLRVRRPCA